MWMKVWFLTAAYKGVLSMFVWGDACTTASLHCPSKAHAHVSRADAPEEQSHCLSGPSLVEGLAATFSFPYGNPWTFVNGLWHECHAPGLFGVSLVILNLPILRMVRDSA